jgi:hypothetical protein
MNYQFDDDRFSEAVDRQARLNAVGLVINGHDTAGERTGPFIKSSKDFITNFVPPDYLIDGLLQQEFLYSNTGATGAGKTAVTLRLAASVALGIPFANR